MLALKSNLSDAGRRFFMTEFLSFSPKTGDCDFDRINRLQSRMNSRLPSICLSGRKS